MFYIPKFQSGEAREVAEKLEKGEIPCLEVYDMEEFEYFVKTLGAYNYFLIKDWELDKKARDTVKEPEFEFRAAFYETNVNASETVTNKIKYIDVYFEAQPEDTYDNCGEM